MAVENKGSLRLALHARRAEGGEEVEKRSNEMKIPLRLTPRPFPLLFSISCIIPLNATASKVSGPPRCTQHEVPPILSLCSQGPMCRKRAS